MSDVLGSDVGGGGAGSASSPPKVLIWWKSGQNLWNLHELPENMNKNGAQHALTWKIDAQNDVESFFFRGDFLLFLEFFFWQVRENSGKNPSHPQNFTCSYTYGVRRQSIVPLTRKRRTP